MLYFNIFNRSSELAEKSLFGRTLNVLDIFQPNQHVKKRCRDILKIDDTFFLVIEFYKSRNISKYLFQNAVSIVRFAFEK